MIWNALRVRFAQKSRKKIFIISEHRSVCGRSGVPFSRVGSWRKTAFAVPLSAKVRRCGGIPLPSSPAAMPPVPHSVADATCLPGRGESVQGDGFRGDGKVPGLAQRRPLGGAVERSETEGV